MIVEPGRFIERHVVRNIAEVEYVGGSLKFSAFQLRKDMRSGLHGVELRNCIIVPAGPSS